MFSGDTVEESTEHQGPSEGPGAEFVVDQVVGDHVDQGTGDEGGARSPDAFGFEGGLKQFGGERSDHGSCAEGHQGGEERCG